MSQITAQSRAAFGITNPKRFLLVTLILGAGMCGVGLALSQTVVWILGVCVLMSLPMFLLMFAAGRAQRVALVVGDDGLTIERAKGREVIPYADITGIADLRMKGGAANLGIETVHGRRDIGTMALRPEDVDKVVAALRARTQRAA